MGLLTITCDWLQKLYNAVLSVPTDPRNQHRIGQYDSDLVGDTHFSGIAAGNQVGS